MNSFEYLDSANQLNSMAATDANLALGAREDMTNTLRSLRDTVALSFQTLNMTMTSMNMTLRNINSSMNRNTAFGPDSSHIPYAPTMVNTGSLSPQMSQYLASTGFTDLYRGNKPFNVNPFEWSQQRQRELDFRVNQFRYDLPLSLAEGTANIGGSMFLGNMVQKGLLSRGVGAGIAGALGMVSQFPIGMAISAVASPYIDAVREQSDSYHRDIYGIQRMSTRFGSEFTLNQSAQVAQQLSRMGLNEQWNTTNRDTRVGTEGFRNILYQGLQSNMFQGSSPEDMIKQLEKGAQVVKLLTGVLGSKDINETMAFVSNIKQAGVNMFGNNNFASMLTMSANKYSSMMGVSAQDLLSQSYTHGVQTFHSLGMPGAAGLMPAMHNAANVHYMEKMGILSPAMLAVGGGHMGIARTATGALGNMLQMAPFGKMMIASGMTGPGQFSSAMMNQNQAGGLAGIIGGAAGALGDIHTYLSMEMNYPDIIAGLADKKGGNAAQQMMIKHLSTMFKGLPDFGAGHDMDKQRNLRAHIIMQNVPGVDLATARYLAEQTLNPNLAGAAENEANAHLKRGNYFNSIERNSMFRSFHEAANFWTERVPASIKQAFVTDVGIGLVNNLTSMDHLSGKAVPAHMLPTMANLKFLHSEHGGFSARNELDRINDSQRKSILNMSGHELGIQSGGLAFLDRLVGSDADKSLAAIMSGGMAGNFGDYYNTIRTGGAKSMASALAHHSGILEGSAAKMDPEEFMRLMRTSSGSTQDSIGGGYFALAQSGAVSEEKIDELYEGLRSRHGAKFGTTGMRGDLERLGLRIGASDVTAQEVMSVLGQGAGAEAEKLARRHGMTTRELVAGAVDAYSTQTKTGDSLYRKVAAMQTNAAYTDLAMAYDSSSGTGKDAMERYYNLGTQGSFTLNDKQLAEYQAKYGLTAGVGTALAGAYSKDSGVIDDISRVVISRAVGDDAWKDHLKTLEKKYGSKIVTDYASNFNIKGLRDEINTSHVTMGANGEAVRAPRIIGSKEDLENIERLRQKFAGELGMTTRSTIGVSTKKSIEDLWGFTAEESKAFLENAKSPDAMVGLINSYGDSKDRGMAFDAMRAQLNQAKGVFGKYDQNATVSSIKDANHRAYIKELYGDKLDPNTKISTLYEKSVNEALKAGGTERSIEKQNEAQSRVIGDAMSKPDANSEFVINVKIVGGENQASKDRQQIKTADTGTGSTTVNSQSGVEEGTRTANAATANAGPQ